MFLLFQLRVGEAGPRVQQYIQTLPRSDVHMRNDFSHLGLPVPQQLDGQQALSDEVSVISATAAVHVSQQQVSTAKSRYNAVHYVRVTQSRRLMACPSERDIGHLL